MKTFFIVVVLWAFLIIALYITTDSCPNCGCNNLPLNVSTEDDKVIGYYHCPCEHSWYKQIKLTKTD